MFVCALADTCGHGVGERLQRVREPGALRWVQAVRPRPRERALRDQQLHRGEGGRRQTHTQELINNTVPFYKSRKLLIR